MTLGVLPSPAGDPLTDDDFQLALACCYELHYRGLAGVSDGWEWEPSLLRFRGRLEGAFETALRDECHAAAPTRHPAVAERLWEMAQPGKGRSLSAWCLVQGTRWHARELAVHRSPYQLKEADPHTWGIPRLTGRSKAAMVAIQADEYGNGVAADMHSSLFADTMRALDLDASYLAYVDSVPGTTLATTNLISMLGLHRRLRGALVGHLALFEMTSVEPMRRYGRWLERIGVPPRGRAFYDVHVEADAWHQQLAVTELVGGLLADEPALAPEVLFGAEALTWVERRFSSHILDSWSADVTSLRQPLPAGPAGG